MAKRGRPPGTGKDDSSALNLMALILCAGFEKKVRPAARVVAGDPKDYRAESPRGWRLRNKYRENRSDLECRANRILKTRTLTMTKVPNWGTWSAIQSVHRYLVEKPGRARDIREAQISLATIESVNRALWRLLEKWSGVY